ncbi:50S ribosomal protein L22 [Candidatus Gottesmanbacteria bacterium RIFCSPHIGHO2_02_FULL_39_14]|uniref:Large ribosomal subunit protein uL22 n=1 Tax=Candidatus Gottesmanbacteria bacterium RIFCSPHIGHO2_02_FULL_39_14 TaxID=1798383 RepID=A0A1F5ZUC3_9BACT|nr:MAG: 50S ribosomal protein L22 [Candidatus Gottesmanbacteria bacterium RIFCSPHIGHO2_02_FULL_39_14]
MTINMEAVSQIKYLRISPKKIKQLGRLTVGLSPQNALDRLEHLSGKAPKLLSKAISSAKSNAVNNLKLNLQNLVIRQVSIGKGPFFKRWQPVSRGMAHSIKKRTAHITIKVGEKEIKAPEKKEPEKISAKGKPPMLSGKKEAK